MLRSLSLTKLTWRDPSKFRSCQLLTMEGVQLNAESHPKSPTMAKSSSGKKRVITESPIGNLSIDSPKDRPFRVSIEGNIGAGKSTLIKYFENFPGIETHGEPIEWWRNLNGYNLFDLMYTNIHEWLKVFQSYVQLTRLKVQTSQPKTSDITVQIYERSVQNNRFCFLEQAFKSGTLSGADYVVLDQWYQWIRDNVNIDLDLIVYLRSTPEIVYERMKLRNRPEEKEVPLEYLQQLHDSHETWLMGDDSPNTVTVLVLDADKTLEEITEQYKLNESKILGHEQRRDGKSAKIDRDKVKRALNLD